MPSTSTPNGSQVWHEVEKKDIWKKRKSKIGLQPWKPNERGKRKRRLQSLRERRGYREEKSKKNEKKGRGLHFDFF
jgi:hypothetical protein